MLLTYSEVFERALVDNRSDLVEYMAEAMAIRPDVDLVDYAALAAEPREKIAAQIDEWRTIPRPSVEERIVQINRALDEIRRRFEHASIYGAATSFSGAMSEIQQRREG